MVKTKNRHLFIDGITKTPLLKQWEVFTLNHYDESTNLDEHIFVYIIQVGLYSIQDVVMCKAFPTTFNGLTLEWFTSLWLYSLDYFETLSSLFISQFFGSHAYPIPPCHFSR